jgi:hypothetical protein
MQREGVFREMRPAGVTKTSEKSPRAEAIRRARKLAPKMQRGSAADEAW